MQKLSRIEAMGFIFKEMYGKRMYKEGIPCEHTGCLHHLSHPCENCGRIGGKYVDIYDRIKYLTDEKCKMSPLEKALKLCEETGEVAEAILSHNKTCACAYKGKTRQDILEELADVIVVAMSIYFQNCSDLDLDGAIRDKLDRWESRL